MLDFGERLSALPGSTPTGICFSATDSALPAAQIVLPTDGCWMKRI
jgi:hypothetical protein